MLTVGDRLPPFTLTGVVSSEADTAFETVEPDRYAGKWLVLFFYPKDFTFVCPTELAGFGRLSEAFQARGAQLLGASTDSEYVHLAWRQQHPDLKELPYPLLSDLKRELSQELGVLDPAEGVCRRATFIVDPDRVIRFAYVTDGKVGRNPEEVLRVLDALQTDELTACGWKKGEATL